MIRTGNLVLFDNGMHNLFSYTAGISRACRDGHGSVTGLPEKYLSIVDMEVMENTQLVRAEQAGSDIDRSHCIRPARFDGHPCPCMTQGIGIPMILHALNHA